MAAHIKFCGNFLKSIHLKYIYRNKAFPIRLIWIGPWPQLYHKSAHFRCQIINGLIFKRTLSRVIDGDLGAWRPGQWRWVGSRLALSIAVLAVCQANLTEKNDRLFSSVKQGNVEQVQRLCDEGVDVNVKHELGWTALHVAVVNKNQRAVEILLRSGADVNGLDEFSNYNRVSHDKQINSLQVLMRREDEFSDRLNIRASFKGCTPLHYAVLMDSPSIVKLLIQSGADPTLENEMGHRAEAYARSEEIRRELSAATDKFETARLKREAEERRRYPLERRLRDVIIGQDSAINSVASTIRRRENGWVDDEHPIVFLFLGSSGIGKTELAKQLGRYLYKDINKSFIRLDMSEYQEKHEVAKLIGSPPGYVGHDDGGQLTKKLRACPDALVLLDEVEKAHPDILTVMLQLFDEGRLTDGKGQTINCKGAVFVMTSNLGSEEIAGLAVQLREEAEQVNKAKQHGKLDEEGLNEKVQISKQFKEKIIKPILKKHFLRDEFLGRINEIVYFVPFSRSELIKLVLVQLNHWSTKAKKTHDMELSWDHSVLDVLADGYDVHYGARSIKHEVERRVISQLALAHERGLIGRGSVVRLTVDNHASLTKPSQQQQHQDSAQPLIKLQLLSKASSKHTYIDLDLSPVTSQV